MRSVLVVLLLLAGCGAPAPDLVPAAPPPSDVNGAALDPAALATWADFPVDARPRPLLIDELPALPRDGFTGDGAKQAVLAGAYDLVATLPADPPPTVEVSLPEGRVRLGTVTAREAFAALTKAPASGPRVAVTAVTYGSASFGTDRGGRVLPAWLFTVAQSTGPLAWPAITPSAFRATSGMVHGATISADGRTVVTSMPAGAERGCPGTPRIRHVPVTLESPTAVDIGLRAVADGMWPGTPEPWCGPCPDCASDAALRMATYRVPLAAPLGNRVLLGRIAADYTVVLAVDPERPAPSGAG